MKNLKYLPLLLAGLLRIGPFGASLVWAQSPERTTPSVAIRPVGCCQNYPLKLTLGGEMLLDAFKNLVSGEGTRQCHGRDVVNYSSAMPLKYFTSLEPAGLVTFTAFYRTDGALKGIFRVIWGSDSAQFAAYQACEPRPIIWPAHFQDSQQNHVYSAKLIPIKSYKTHQGPKDLAAMASVPGIAAPDIAQILNVFVEDRNGYIATTENASYKHPFSSKGVVVVLRLKDTSLVSCYLINDYDNNYLLWKEPNNCQGLNKIY